MKLFVTNVLYFLVLFEFVSLLVDWLSVDSEVSCLSSGAVNTDFSCGTEGTRGSCGVGVGAGVGEGLVVSVEDSKGL